MTEDTLQFSSNSGRYQVGSDELAPDVTSGAACEIYLNGTWTPGHIEHAPVYAVERHVVSKAKISGYYFIARDGSVCGLCVGMRVRI